MNRTPAEIKQMRGERIPNRRRLRRHPTLEMPIIAAWTRSAPGLVLAVKCPSSAPHSGGTVTRRSTCEGTRRCRGRPQNLLPVRKRSGSSSCSTPFRLRQDSASESSCPARRRSSKWGMVSSAVVGRCGLCSTSIGCTELASEGSCLKCLQTKTTLLTCGSGFG